jgi:hypothetical protein
MNRQADYRPTEVVFTTAQEPVLEKTPEKEKPKYLTGEGHTLGVQGNKRDIVGSKEYKSDQRCQKLTEKDKCVAPCSWNESEEPHCRYEEVIKNVSEVAARIITDSDYISEFTESLKELKCLSASECKKTRKVIVDDTKKIEEDLKEFSKVLQKSSLLASSIDLHSEKAVRDTIRDTILAEAAAASASATPKSSSKASSKASSPKASSPKSSPKALSPKASPMSAATTDLLSDTHSWFSSAIASFDERREQELSEEQEKELEERENEFYKANISWLYSDSIAQGILTVKREEEAKKLQESLRKNNEKREKENAIAKAKQDKVDAIASQKRNEMLKGYATAGWSSAMGAIEFIGKGTLGALSLTGKALSVTGKVIGSTINLGVKTGEFGLRALNTGLDYLKKSQKSKRATKASAKASAKASPSPDDDDEVVFLGETKRPNPRSKAAVRVSSAAASPPSPPPQAPTCEAIMDEEPCEGAKIGTYGCNWMDGRRPLCLQSQSNKNNEGILQIFNRSNTESWSETKVANYINDPTSPIYQFWRRGRNALITRWAKERLFGDNFMGTKATTNKRGYRTKGGNRKTKKRNNKRNNKK